MRRASVQLAGVQAGDAHLHIYKKKGGVAHTTLVHFDVIDLPFIMFGKCANVQAQCAAPLPLSGTYR